MYGPAKPGLPLARRNQVILAERLHWPDGALRACWELENRFPGWHVSWMRDWPVEGFERTAGFYAWRADHRPLVKTGMGGYVRRRELYGADAAAIAAELARMV